MRACAQMFRIIEIKLHQLDESNVFNTRTLQELQIKHDLVHTSYVCLNREVQLCLSIAPNRCDGAWYLLPDYCRHAHAHVHVRYH